MPHHLITCSICGTVLLVCTVHKFCVVLTESVDEFCVIILCDFQNTKGLFILEKSSLQNRSLYW